MPHSHPRPLFDPEPEAILTSATDELPPTLTAEMIPLLREANPAEVPPEQVLAGTGIIRRDVTIKGFEGAEIVVSVLQRDGAQEAVQVFTTPTVAEWSSVTGGLG
ncbi:MULTISPECIES: hypothetical protein [Micrococcaceae]|uniref:hypothetical protein n=1 Tax=Micrococcaceae TaxID=1268 RepID=UPI001F5F3C8F|nr:MULTISPECIES: hypothetical protein [Micrococcaceae]UXN33424.1 hypothetical protein N6V40_08590 [Glutamicibacter sp. M10]